MSPKRKAIDLNTETRRQVVAEKYGKVLNGHAMRAKASSHSGKQGAAGYVIKVVDEIYVNGKLKKSVTVGYYGCDGNGGIGSFNKSRRKGLVPFASRDQALRAARKAKLSY